MRTYSINYFGQEFSGCRIVSYSTNKVGERLETTMIFERPDGYQFDIVFTDESYYNFNDLLSAGEDTVTNWREELNL